MHRVLKPNSFVVDEKPNLGAWEPACSVLLVEIFTIVGRPALRRDFICIVPGDHDIRNWLGGSVFHNSLKFCIVLGRDDLICIKDKDPVTSSFGHE